jgi:uncharacterized protein YukE
MIDDASDSTMTPPAQTAAAGEKQIPLWVAIAVMAMILIAGAVLVFKYANRPPPAPAPAPKAINVVTPAPGQPRIARSGPNPVPTPPAIDPLLVAREAELADGIHTLPTGGTMVKAGDAYIKAIRLPEDPGPALSFGSFTVSDEQWVHGYLSNGVRRLLGDPEYAKSLAVTADQIKQLEALPGEPSMRWPRDARDRFADLYKKWDATPPAQKPAAEKELVGALREYAQAKRAADQTAMGQRVAKIRAILTGPQVEKLNPIPRWDLPTTKPSPAPAPTQPKPA